MGAAAALASLDVFAEDRTLEQLPAKVARLAEHLDRIRQLPHVGVAGQCGLIAGIELMEDVAAGVPYPWTAKRGIRACDAMRERGVLLRPLGNVLVIMPPLAITLEELDRICVAVEHGIRVATT